MLRLRPSTREDDEDVLRLLDTRERHDSGIPDLTRGLVLDQWRSPEFDPGADAIVVEDEGRIVGYGAVFAPGAVAFVDPAREGERIGTELLAWVETRAREQGHPTHRQPIGGHNASGHELLERAGYRLVRAAVLMERSLRDLPSVPARPDGLAVRQLDVVADAEALHQASGDAFAANADFESESFEEFVAEHLKSAQLDPALSLVVRRGERIVAFSLCRRLGEGIGYVDLLAVDSAERRRGLGRFLVLSAFAAFGQAGLARARLDVASDNPIALRLYERAGMTQVHRADVFEKPEPANRD